MECYITRSGSYLPGAPVDNDGIERFLGTMPGESGVKQQVLKMNGILRRHYAQDLEQRETENVYQLAAQAVERCLQADNLTASSPAPAITFLAAGSTYAPYSGPGLASLIHPLIASRIQGLNRPLELSSHAGICTSAAAALVNAVRAIRSGEHAAAIAVGAEHASEVLKSEVMKPIDDRSMHAELRNSQWFMSVFLRFMLSDGAGAFLLQNRPNEKGLSLVVDWTHSMSMAHECPLCMKLENSTRLLSQDIRILNRHLFSAAESFALTALQHHGEKLTNYKVVLPHLSSFFFRRKMEKMFERLCDGLKTTVPYWTNLATAGNTGSASIYVMLDEYLDTHSLSHGDRLLLFIPESGQFNFVLVSLTAVVHG